MKRLLALALVLLPTPICAQPETYGVTPGYWEVESSLLGLTSTERDCLVPERIAKAIGGPCNHHYKCTYPIQQVGNGKVHFEGDLRGKGEFYHLKGGGVYSATAFDMSASVAGHWHILPLAGTLWVKAHFLAAECPAGSKKL